MEQIGTDWGRIWARSALAREHQGARPLGAAPVEAVSIDDCVQRPHPSKARQPPRGFRKEKGAFEKGVGPYVIEISKKIDFS